MGGSTHPNVPFLAKHPAWGAPAETTTHSDSPSPAGGWDREGLGWSGFRTSDRLLIANREGLDGEPSAKRTQAAEEERPAVRSAQFKPSPPMVESLSGNNSLSR